MTKFEEELSNLPVSIITNYGDYWNKAQLLTVFKDWQPQQDLPVVPECVAGVIEKDKQANLSISDVFEATFSYENHHLTEAGLWTKNNPEEYIVARNIGYTVEKPQLFRLKLKNTPISNYYLWLNQATGKVFVDKKFLDWTNHDNVKNIFTEQEIAKISDGAFVNNKAFELVPVEDGE